MKQIIDEVDHSIFKISKNNGISNILKTSSSKKDKSEIVYNLLGNRASSILLVNVIIWVEGPSDRVYLNH